MNYLLGVVYCEDGYVAATPALEFLRVSGMNEVDSKYEAALKMNLGD